MSQDFVKNAQSHRCTWADKIFKWNRIKRVFFRLPFFPFEISLNIANWLLISFDHIVFIFLLCCMLFQFWIYLIFANETFNCDFSEYIWINKSVIIFIHVECRSFVSRSQKIKIYQRMQFTYYLRPFFLVVVLNQLNLISMVCLYCG